MKVCSVVQIQSSNVRLKVRVLIDVLIIQADDTCTDFASVSNMTAFKLKTA